MYLWPIKHKSKRDNKHQVAYILQITKVDFNKQYALISRILQNQATLTVNPYYQALPKIKGFKSKIF